ncbi:unnamed protein product [Ostreobium quekettii]|uniref:Uncharacterized protein n=1 Tax=Ostreobium quekettii TaxID=121088 RepID=A0A8S1IL82_9CHLO|nr:unnamed protein product [Ostreobium quekettii]|eukprot:evm.model.scf_162EXC.5 EVM.evm.TU.scf_162EXC.5   scf_162EXC:37581-38537(+)
MWGRRPGAGQPECLEALTLDQDAESLEALRQCDSVEDLPEAIVSASIVDLLARQCLRSAVRLSVTSKLLHSLFICVVTADSELSDQLLARQEGFDSGGASHDPRASKIWKAAGRVAWAIARASFSCGTLFLCCCGALVALCIYLILPIIRGIVSKSAGMPLAPWVFLSLVMAYVVSLVWVETGVAVGRLLRPRDRDLISMVRWFLLLPFMETVALFVMSAFCNQALMAQGDHSFLAGFVAPQLLMSLTMYAQFFAFLTWARGAAIQDMHMSARVRVLHLCHIASLMSLGAYVFFYYRRLLGHGTRQIDWTVGGSWRLG